METIMLKTNLISFSEDHQEYVINFRIQRQHISCRYLLYYECSCFEAHLPPRFHSCTHRPTQSFDRTAVMPAAGSSNLPLLHLAAPSLFLSDCERKVWFISLSPLCEWFLFFQTCCSVESLSPGFCWRCDVFLSVVCVVTVLNAHVSRGLVKTVSVSRQQLRDEPQYRVKPRLPLRTYCGLEVWVDLGEFNGNWHLQLALRLLTLYRWLLFKCSWTKSTCIIC